jgi:hypothetical protein
MSRKYGSNNSAKPKYAGLKLKNRLVKAQEINTCSSPAQHKQLFPEKKAVHMFNSMTEDQLGE